MIGCYKIVTLCGSTRFKDEFMKVMRELTLRGYIVISVGCFGHAGDVFTDEQKIMLDAMHKRKIDMADGIFVIDVGGYIGSSTKSEIEYAEKTGKTVQYLSRTEYLNRNLVHKMRLINADALMSQAFSTIQGYDAVLVEDIVNAPTVEANPIINAQWELVRYDPDYLMYSARCTNCKKVHESNDNVAKLPFCPHCGAAMQGERVPKLISAEEE